MPLLLASLHDLLVMMLRSIQAPLAVLQELALTDPLAFNSFVPLVFPALTQLLTCVATRGAVRPVIDAVVASALSGTPLLQLAPRLSRAIADVLIAPSDLTEVLDDLKVRLLSCFWCFSLVISQRNTLITHCLVVLCPLLQFVTRHLCSVCLPASPLPVSAFVVFLPVIARVLGAKPSLPILQPALAWLNIHVTPSKDAIGAVQRFVDNTNGDGIDVTLSDTVTVPLPASWATVDDVADAEAIVATYVALLMPPYKSRDLAKLSPATETETGTGVPFALIFADLTAIGIESPLHEHLSRRLCRDTLSRALLQAVAVSPKGTPSPDEVLRHAVLGNADGPSAVSSFDVCDVGECGCP
jgi:hypothetical protein